MSLFDLGKELKSEKACEKHLKELRGKEGVVCSTCGCKEHYWDSSNKRWTCKKCGHVTTLTAGTVMHNSKLPLLYWFKAIHLIGATKTTFSAKEMQRQLKHKRYQPIWEMMHKLRSAMGLRDMKYELGEVVELDEAYITTDDEESREVTASGRNLKHGVGSERKSKIVVMVESKERDKSTKSGGTRRIKSSGYIKINHVPDTKSDTLKEMAERSIKEGAVVKMDDSSSHSSIGSLNVKTDKRVVPAKQASTMLPWVHKAISNLKSLILCTYKYVKDDFLQYYIDEFCYKYNRRCFYNDSPTNLKERLEVACVERVSTFKHRTYR